MIPKDQAKALQVASAKQSFKEFEQGVALPLASNSYFRSFRQSCTDVPNKINYLNFGKKNPFSVLIHKASTKF